MIMTSFLYFRDISPSADGKSYFCPETKVPKILHSTRGDGSTQTKDKTEISASLR